MTAARTARLLDVVTSRRRRAGYEQAGLWTAETLVDRVRRHAARDGDRIAVVDRLGKRETTYAQLDGDSNRVANYLIDGGVQPGDVVSVQLPSWYETVAIDVGILKAGAVLNPLLPIYRRRELTHVLGVGEVRVLFTPTTYRNTDHAAMIRDARADLPQLEHHVVVADPTGADDRFRTWLEAWPSSPPQVALDAAAVSELLFTSGTEAQPKAIMHTEQTAGFAVTASAVSLRLRPDDVVFMPSPIGHSTGLNFGVRMALHHGLPVVLLDHWNPTDAAALIERYAASYSVAATTFVSDLIAEAEQGRARLGSLRLFGCGGAPVAPEVVAAAARHGIQVLRLYGSTEVFVATWERPDPEPGVAPGSTDGPALDHVEVEVRSAEGTAVAQDVAGEIYVRGPNTSVGFFNDPERTSATYLEDGWLRTGDLGVLDAGRRLTIVGRSKEIIIRGGLNIAPREIEDVVSTHDAVVDVAVVGLADPRLGERTCACVVLRPGTTLELPDLVAFLRAAGMAAYKLPERLEVLDALPRTATGKVQKFAIVEMLSAQSEATAQRTPDHAHH